MFALLTAAVALGFAALSHAAQHTAPQRVVSINACTDQLLWALADREQIAALSHYAADPAFFTEAGTVRARGVRLISGNAEEVMKLKPDLVLAGSFTRRATREWLRRAGIPLITFPAADSIEATKSAIAQTAALLGHPARGQAIIAGIDAALAELSAAAGRADLSALQVQRRGFTSGADTLLGDLLARAGIANAAGRLGVGGVRRVSLEAILKARADLLVLSSAQPSASDQGSALLLHPALASRYPPERRIVIPENLIVCGGPSLAQAIRHMARAARALPVADRGHGLR